MKQKDFISNLDDLINAIEVVLSKNRSSLSIDDVVCLESVILELNELKKVTKISDRKEFFIKLLPEIFRTFFRPEVLEEFRKILETFVDF